MVSQLVSIKSKKIALSLTLLRQNQRKSVKEVAYRTGISDSDLSEFEGGSQSPSLPQLEQIAKYYAISVDDLLSGSVTDEPEAPPDPDKLVKLFGLRNRMIGAMIQKARNEKLISRESLAEISEIPVETIELYETGFKAIPAAELDLICKHIDLPIHDLLSVPGIEKAPLNPNLPEQPQNLPAFSASMMEFISNPANKPYIDLAKRLSEMDADKLRTIAEGLLEITY